MPTSRLPLLVSGLFFLLIGIASSPARALDYCSASPSWRDCLTICISQGKCPKGLPVPVIDRELGKLNEKKTDILKDKTKGYNTKGIPPPMTPQAWCWQSSCKSY
jgi:hypothetical protein